MKLIYTLLTFLCLATLAGCAKLDTPQPGRYRAALHLKGGDASLMLDVTDNQPSLQIALVAADTTVKANNVGVQNHILHATWPNQWGELQAKFGRKTLTGEWHLQDAQGKAVVIPFDAQLGENYRFVEKSLTDNADLSGYWTLKTSSVHSDDAKGAALELSQTHDAIDGDVTLPDTQAGLVFGQVHDNDVYLTALTSNRITLLKGKVNNHGDMEGKLWTNLDAAETWSATRSDDPIPATALHESANDDTRKVAFPWAIPTQ